MGKASSAKKVARAARAGGIKRTNRPRLSFPLAIVAVIVLGSATVVYARASHDSMAGEGAKPSYRDQDHWHAAYGFWNCDKWVPALKDIEGKPDDLGIHTHGDGVIHTHPFKASSSGERARLKLWGEMVGVEFFDDGWKLPDGTEFRQGSATCGDKPARVAIYRWKVDPGQAVIEGRTPVEVFNSGFGDIYLGRDREAITFAVMPEDAPEPAPKPESLTQLDQLTDVEGSTAAGAGGLPGGAEGLDLGNLPGGGVPGGAPAEGGAGAPAPADPAAPNPAPATP